MLYHKKPASKMETVLARLRQAPDVGPLTIQTRKALIIINLQNDSLYVKDDVYITKNQDFVLHLKEMIPYFRRHGDIIWVLTHMGVAPSVLASKGSAPPQESTSTSAQAAEHDQDERAHLRNERLIEIARDEASRGELDVVDPDAGNDYPMFYPSSKTKQMMSRAPAEAKAEKRSADMQVFDDKDSIAEKYYSRPKQGQRSRFFIAGTRGAQIADELLDEIDDSHDMIMTKRHYSAFDSTSLLTQLRASLVTDVYLAGCMTNVGIYSTAADAVQHGLSVTVVEDCLGYRSEEKHEEAMRQMADIMGVSAIDSEEIIEESGGRPVPDAETPGITLEELSLNSPTIASRSGPALRGGENVQQQDASRKPAAAGPSRAKENTSSSKPMTRSAPHGKAALTDSAAGNSGKRKQGGDHPRNPSPGPSGTKSRRSWNLSRSQILGPKDSIGSGDSKIIYKALSRPLVDTVFDQLKNEVDWQTMFHRSGQVPRLVAVQGGTGPGGQIPIYRHPADESPPLFEFTPTVQKIRQEAESLLGQSFNHALIQLYRDGVDNISEHADKTLDIVRNSMIVNVSLGAQRSMTLRVKKSKHTHGTDSPSMRQSQRIKMPHNSVFVLGPQTNREWLHGVRADKRPTAEKSEDEKAFGGERISITFRQIGTFMSKKDKTIWGAGAKAKRRSHAGKISTKDSVQMDAMIQAFGNENHNADFDWDKYYGKGFDVVNLINEQAKLFLCSDPVANLRVQLALCEKAISFTTTERKKPIQPEYGAIESRFQPWIHGLSNIENPILHDVDDNATEIEGDVAILFYLEKNYPFHPGDSEENDSPPLQQDTSRLPNIYSQISQSNDLLFLWRQLCASQTGPTIEQERPPTHRFELEKSNSSLHDELHSTLEAWEEQAKEHEYIISDTWSIIDCAFWPVLRHLMTDTEDGDVDWEEYPHLQKYDEKVMTRDCVKIMLEEGS